MVVEDNTSERFIEIILKIAHKCVLMKTIKTERW